MDKRGSDGRRGMTAMNDVLEEKLQAVSKVLGELAESAAEKTSNLADVNGVDLSSVAHGAAARARRGGQDAAAAAKSQLRSGVRGARSGVHGLIEQKESLADFGPSVADIRQVKKSIRRFKKAAKREGRELASALDKKTGGRRPRAKGNKTGWRTAIVVVAAVAIGFAVARVVRTKSTGDSPASYPGSMGPDRTPPDAARQPRPTEAPDPTESEPGVRAGSRANGS
jgi:hypothetical protein